jgi:hypothetical protein
VVVHYRSRVARLLLPKRYVAITLGSHVLTRASHLEERVLRHEQAHVEQWKRHGLLRFLFAYVWFHFRYGYDRNPFEVEARAAERSPPSPKASARQGPGALRRANS